MNLTNKYTYRAAQPPATFQRFTTRANASAWMVVTLVLTAFLLLCLDDSLSQAKSARSKSRSGEKVRIAKSKYVKKKPAKRKSKKKKRTRKGIQAKAVYCVNLSSNKTLMARNPDRQLPVASLTKLVTALVTLEHMPLHRKVRVPAHIKRIPKSVVGLKAGDRVSVKDLLHGLLMQSGNDCAETLACAFPKGRSRFIRAMNKKARDIKARRTRFYTPSGLDMKLVRTRKGKKSVRIKSNVSTAREIAHIARIAFSNSVIRSISRKKSYVMASSRKKAGYRVKNTNKLLRGSLPIIGGKTGYTARAGRCLATEFTPGRNIFVIVVLGSPNHFRDTRLVYHRALKQVSMNKPRVRSRHSSRPTGRTVSGS
jgi:D-alanyl-D-alanine carboxypeptidase